MSYLDNRPQVGRVLEHLAAVPSDLMAKFDPPEYPLLATLLDDAIADVEDVCATRFNATMVVEKYDGNTTNQVVLRKRPALQAFQVKVITPILGYTRVYNQDEIKLYRKQGVLKVFTYKLAVEQALLQTVDYQAWGSLFPPLPQAVVVTYSYGYPQYDPDLDKTTTNGGADVTIIDHPSGQPVVMSSVEDGDTRDPQETNWLRNLQEAASLMAAANFLSQHAPLAVGLVQAVSFDGYSRSMNPAAFVTQAQEFRARADAILKRRRRQFAMATLGQ
jgi:hypothetical protein